MKKIISVVLLCAFLSSSAQAQLQWPVEVKDRISRVAGLYAGAVKFYYHALTTKNTGMLRDEAGLLLNDMRLELSRPEYRKAVSGLRNAVQGSDDGAAQQLDLFLPVAESDGDLLKTDTALIQQESDNACQSYPRVMGHYFNFIVEWIGVLVRGLLNILAPWGIPDIIDSLGGICLDLIIIATLFLQWPLCLLGIGL